MVLRSFLAPIKWVVALGLLAGLLGLAYWVHGEMQKERAREASGDKVEQPRRIETNQIKLSAELAESHLIETVAAEPAAWYERVTVYGRVVPNPRAAFEVRSPFAGTVRAEPGKPWRVPGERVRAGQALGWVDIRVGPAERLDLQAKLDEARQKVKGAKDVLHIQQERADRLETVSRDNPKSIPQRDWDEAQIGLAEARAQVGTYEAAVKLWENALQEIDQRKDLPNSTWSRPLIAPAGGEITELAAQPGTTVEAGGLVLRIVDFSRPLARLDLPPEVLAAGPPPEKVELTGLMPLPSGLRGATHRPNSNDPAELVKATLIGSAPQVDAASQFAVYWYEVDPKSPASSRAGAAPGHVTWRPGLFVKSALIAPQARVQEAVAVSATALLYHQGRTLVYVSREPETLKGREMRVFERREVRVLGRQGDKCVLEPRDPLRDASGFGVEPGDAVVSQNAQMLLSEEFRSDADD